MTQLLIKKSEWRPKQINRGVHYQNKLFLFRVLFGEYGSGKTQLLIEKVRQTAWDLHYRKVQIVFYWTTPDCQSVRRQLLYYRIINTVRTENLLFMAYIWQIKFTLNFDFKSVKMLCHIIDKYYILGVPKFTANLYCICLSISKIYTYADAVQIFLLIT